MTKQAKQLGLDKAYQALVNQKTPGFNYDDGVCMYRDINPSTQCEVRCAIGHLIPGDILTKFEAGMDGWGAAHVMSSFPEIASAIFEEIGIDITTVTAEQQAEMVIYLGKMQTAHDNAAMMHTSNPELGFLDLLKENFKVLAIEYELEWNHG